jgi:hypothetical protein
MHIKFTEKIVTAIADDKLKRAAFTGREEEMLIQTSLYEMFLTT